MQKIKALVSRWDKVTFDTNNPYQKENVKNLAKQHTKEIVKLESQVKH